jgi:alpha-ribazole phosphatase
MKLVLVRHPAPDIRPGLCYGRLDIPLHPTAAATVGRVAADLSRSGVARVRTSPARRCRVLAEAVGELCGVAPVADARLQELDFGAWEGLPWDEVPRAALDAWAASPMLFAPPGGEAGAALVERVRAVRDEIRLAREDCVVVSHGGPLKVLAALLRGERPDLLASPPPLGSAMAFML